MEMDEQTRLAFQFASEWAKQLITLSTGILAVSITFTKDVLRPSAPIGLRWLGASWACYLLTVVLGIGVLSSLTGLLMPASPPATPSPLRFHETVRAFAGAQLITFIVGSVLITVYGVRGLRARDAASYGPEAGAGGPPARQ